MSRRGPAADEEGRGDLRIRPAGDDETQHLELAHGERFVAVDGCTGGTESELTASGERRDGVFEPEEPVGERSGPCVLEELGHGRPVAVGEHRLGSRHRKYVAK